MPTREPKLLWAAVIVSKQHLYGDDRCEQLLIGVMLKGARAQQSRRQEGSLL
jgi:hypothetical protein